MKLKTLKKSVLLLTLFSALVSIPLALNAAHGLKIRNNTQYDIFIEKIDVEQAKDIGWLCNTTPYGNKPGPKPSSSDGFSPLKRKVGEKAGEGKASWSCFEAKGFTLKLAGGSSEADVDVKQFGEKTVDLNDKENKPVKLKINAVGDKNDVAVTINEG